jgi:protocatechuate 3,4-dioxygenase beta subunit
MRTRLGQTMIIVALVGIGCAACGPTTEPTVQQATAAPAPTSSATTAPAATTAPTVAPAATAALSTSAAAGNTRCSDTTRNAQVEPASTITIGHTSALTQSVISADPSEKGERLIVTGTIFAADCTPLAGVAIQVWQTNADGEYGPGNTEDQCCYFGGELETDSAGRYAFETIKPAPYKGEASPPPAHIHFKLSHPDARDFETEMLFKGDPHLGAGNDPALIVALSTEDGPDGPLLRGVFDIVMPGR